MPGSRFSASQLFTNSYLKIRLSGSAESAYVFGQVKNPGAYPIQKDTTVLQALSLAGGVTENGAMNRIKIVRLVNGEKKELKVKETDLVKPGDTIIVPEKYF